MNKKATILVLILLILVVAGGIWYYEIRTSTMPASSTVTYGNDQYDFTVALPASWEGYTVVASTWNSNSGATSSLSGPIISIRNPLWTSSTPTQDIPIMVFTVGEWGGVSSGTIVVSAAPFPPSELGGNANYVFALPARYNYAYFSGWQDVQNILDGNPLHGF